MNFLEFKRQLMVEPGSQSPAFLRVREADERHRQAFAEAMQFESELQQAVQIPVPDDLSDSCINSVFATVSTAADTRDHATASDKHRSWAWLPAMAAGLVMGIALTTAVFVIERVSDDSMAGYLTAHWQDDGPDIISRSALTPMNTDNIQRILATLNLDMNSEYAGKFVFAKNCPTPKGLGLHLVVQSDYGPATVFYMPASADHKAAAYRIDGMQAQLLPLQYGTVAILGNNQQIVDNTSELLRKALRERPMIDA